MVLPVDGSVVWLVCCREWLMVGVPIRKVLGKQIEDG